MTHYTDETIGAYVDGELNPEAAATLEAALPTDPLLRKRVTDIRAIDAALREWSDRQVDPEMSPWPATAIIERNRTRRSLTSYWPHAVAACIALLFGLGLGQFVNVSGHEQTAITEAPTRQLLQAALEHTLSGQSVSWTDGVAQQTFTVEPLRTYRANHAFCREYRETAMTAAPARERTIYGIACRNSDGLWSIEYTLAPGERPLLLHQ